jgi:hypothetical protein
MFANYRSSFLAALSVVLLFCAASKAEDPKVIPAGSKVFIAPMDGFEAYLKAAIAKKRVPITIVDNRDEAAYEISGVASSKKASTAKKIFTRSWHSTEEASIQVTDLKTSAVVFAYSYHREDSMHGKQSSAESCAKHLNGAIMPR